MIHVTVYISPNDSRDRLYLPPPTMNQVTVYIPLNEPRNRLYPPSPNDLSRLSSQTREAERMYNAYVA